MIKLELTADEVNAILQVLGELPTKSGFYPLAMKIRLIAEQQTKKEEEVIQLPE